MRALPLCSFVLVATSLAQVEAPPATFVDYTYDSGPVANASDREEVVISFDVHHTGARWLRLYFAEVELAGDVLAGTGATLRLTSHLDGAVMEMNAIHLRQWQNSSCYLNGDTVQVEVLAPANAGPSRVVMRGLDAGDLGAVTQTICDTTDDRVLSNDPRAARLLPIGCTGWLIEDCAKCFLTAGHCTGALSVAQFNVPLSDSNGNINNPPPEDQYAIDSSSLQTNGGQGVGDDWGYFGTFANSTTGLTAFQAQGAAYVLSLPPNNPNGNDIRITGYGTDSSPPTSNQVQQTNVGPMVVSTQTEEVGYRTDTTGGNSGSPVIWENTGFAVGIHTHGGCSSSGGNNWGTATGHPELQNALAGPTGICSAGFSHPAGLPTLLTPGETTSVQVDVLSSNPTNVTMHYRYDGGTFNAVAMTLLGGETWTADLPAADCDDTPEFFFSADDASCGTVTSPPGAPNDVFSAGVGTLVVSFADDFETDQGWSPTNLGATTGDWQRGVPVNDPNWAYDPASDADGSGSCWLTENAFGNTDVDNGAVRLESPSFDFSAGGAVTYAYFLNLTNDNGTDRLLVEASPNGSAGPWTEVARHDTDGDLAWRDVSLADADFVNAGVPLTANMRLRFTANDTGDQSIVEAGIDAFVVGRLECDNDQIGTIYCSPAVPNSSGQPGTIRAIGSTDVTQNDVTLIAEDLAANQFGYFLTSETQDFVANPGGSQGNLCLGGTIGRYVKQVQNSGATGAFSLQLDLTQLPAPLMGGVQSGETWNFTTWFRDKNPDTTSNFTDAVSILFQ